MVALVTVAAVAFGAALLTLFSGFGLGTLLLPVFALFLPLEAAVAATAVVHLANNLFKVGLVGRHADRAVVVAFGLPAVLAAFIGAGLLSGMTTLAPIMRYEVGRIHAELTWAGIVIGTLLAFFALFDLVPRLRDLTVERRWLPLGGLLSGFFGGLSGLQGALRATFLVKCRLGRDAFVGTGVVVAVLVDLARLLVYGTSFYSHPASALGGAATDAVPALMLTATVAAFAGSFAGSRLLPKVTIGFIQKLVGVSIVLLGGALAAGWI